METGSGLHTEVRIDSAHGLVHKRVLNLPDFEGGLNDVPTADDYERLVGWSLSLLQDSRFGLAQFIPAASVRIEQAPVTQRLSGCECWIDMKLIQGKELATLSQLPNITAQQMILFLDGSLRMLQWAKKQLRQPIIPDLLGGIVTAHDFLDNFIVENRTTDLFFYDVYPLATVTNSLAHPLTVRHYRQRLMRAVERTRNPQIISRGKAIAQAL